MALRFHTPSFCVSGAPIAPPGQEGWREAPGWWFKKITIPNVKGPQK